MKMTIHITKDDTFSNHTFKLIEDFFIQIFKKSFINVKFHNDQYQEDWTEKEYNDIVEEDYKRYLFAYNLMEGDNLAFLQSFQNHFNSCIKFRKKKRINPDHFVVVLTEQKNEPNWFGFIDSTLKNIFVCESNWTGYFRYSVESYLPLSHEIICWIIRANLFKNQKELIQNIHQEDRGCIMDLNRSKSQISRKMKSIEICADCMDYFKTEISPVYSVLSESLKIINFQLKQLTHVLSTSKPSRIVLKGEKCKIFMEDYQNIKVNLEPLQMAVYILFLNHTEGIDVSNAFTKADKTLTPIHQELVTIYCKLTGGDPNRIGDSKAQSVRSRDAEVIRRDISIIKSIFFCILGETLAKKYIIEEDSEKNIHVLKLDNQLVRYEY